MGEVSAVASLDCSCLQVAGSRLRALMSKEAGSGDKRVDII